MSLGRDAEGKRKRRVFYGESRAEVKRKLQDQTAREGGRLKRRVESGTLREWMDAWLAEVARAMAPTTAANYTSTWKKHCEPSIARKRLADFTAEDVGILYRKLHETGVAPATIAKVRVVMHRAFAVARQRGEYIGDNPFGLVQPPRYNAKERKSLTLEQAQRLVEAARTSGDRYEAAVVLAIACGMRLGEILGLKWEDVDWRDKSLSVRRSLQEVNGTFTFSEGKTRTARRKIALGKLATDALRRREKIAIAGADLVFTTEIGTPLSRTNFRERHFQPILKEARVPAVRFHDLRHSFASLLMQRGTPTKVAAEALGHANPAITQRLYQHVIGDLQKTAMVEMDAALQQKGRSRGGRRA